MKNNRTREILHWLMFVTGLCIITSGCGTMRRVEQWKCDNWGMCHFGTQPTAAATPPLPPPQSNCPPPPGAYPQPTYGW